MSTSDPAPTWNPALYEFVVVQANDYSYEGTVVSIFSKTSKQIRYVVEDENERLFIHNRNQLRWNRL